jgi:hypothetical protein
MGTSGNGRPRARRGESTGLGPGEGTDWVYWCFFFNALRFFSCLLFGFSPHPGLLPLPMSLNGGVLEQRGRVMSFTLVG